MIDWNTTLEMAILSHASYDNGEIFTEWYDEVEYFEHKKSDTEAYALSSDGVIVLVMRGSDSPRDWLWNIRKLKRSKEEDLFEGLEGSTDGLIREGILDFVGHHKGEVYITGHSKGGAVAQVLATRIFGVEGVWCFGSPRVGGRKWAKNYPLKHTVHSFSTNFDPVTHLPPWLLGYRRAVELERVGGWGHDMAKYVDEISAKIPKADV